MIDESLDWLVMISALRRTWLHQGLLDILLKASVTFPANIAMYCVLALLAFLSPINEPRTSCFVLLLIVQVKLILALGLSCWLIIFASKLGDWNRMIRTKNAFTVLIYSLMLCIVYTALCVIPLDGVLYLASATSVLERMSPINLLVFVLVIAQPSLLVRFRPARSLEIVGYFVGVLIGCIALMSILSHFEKAGVIISAALLVAFSGNTYYVLRRNTFDERNAQAVNKGA